ncbi:uncharacterized protein BDZ99DRAFT_485897 [Mytilinidion resinicola]|uniref:C4-dicarboxylate transporter/malic acid transport protein n=1 Tax=Mytilinidion resinicola TaxID=574789 RepID=A0A6A6Z0K4_9PEZI|nr:uncharacterized protein BDZ99DRAFT_485897 [Mytilinidion resinicola]KAF2813757.1 hypothetical protein BDZ99DRAFT_485897 [Mytilinidion resinicola]
MTKEQAKYLASGGLKGNKEKMKEQAARTRQKERQREWEREKERVEAERDAQEMELSFRQRMRHFTWTWFTMTMATGGMANVIYTVPYRFHGIYALGCMFFLLNIVLFLFNVGMISTRFYLYPATFKGSFLHPTESLFIPACIISLGTIFINISQYGVGKAGPWLKDAMVYCYWVYCALAVIASCGIFLIMWSTQTHTISRMTPIWIFPAYPLLIIGPFAGVLSAKTTSTTALSIIVSGYTLQGIGFMVSLMIYSAFLYRLMTQKLPAESLRPGMFISVGPSGFTIAGLVTMGAQLPRIVAETGGRFMSASDASPAPSTLTFVISDADAHMTTGLFAAEVSRIMANWAGLWLWGLALWFFIVSVGAHWTPLTRWKMDFGMTWFSFVFPNTALTTATFAVARSLNNNRPIQIVGCVLSVALVVVWMFVAGCMVKAVVGKQILWPQKQEDREEGGIRDLEQTR